MQHNFVGVPCFYGSLHPREACRPRIIAAIASGTATFWLLVCMVDFGGAAVLPQLVGWLGLSSFAASGLLFCARLTAPLGASTWTPL